MTIPFVAGIREEARILASAVTGNQLTLKPNYWRFRLARMYLGEDLPNFMQTAFCPLFWVTNFFVLAYPALLVCSGCLWILCRIWDAFVNLVKSIQSRRKFQQELIQQEEERASQADWEERCKSPEAWDINELILTHGVPEYVRRGNWGDFVRVFGDKAEEVYWRLLEDRQKRREEEYCRLEEARRIERENIRRRNERLMKLACIAKPASQALLIASGLVALIALVWFVIIPYTPKVAVWFWEGTILNAKWMWTGTILNAKWLWANIYEFILVVGAASIVGYLVYRIGRLLKVGPSPKTVARLERIWRGICRIAAWFSPPLKFCAEALSMAINFIRMFYLNNCPVITLEESSGQANPSDSTK